MMDGLEARGRAVAGRGVRRAVARLAERLRDEPGVRVEAGEDRVVLTGRGLWRRLRWIGGMLR